MVEVPGLAEVAAVLGLAEVTAVLEVAEMTEALGLAEMIDQEKCSKQLVVTVETNVRYHLSQKITDPFIAENVFKITNHKNEEAPGLAEVVVVLGLIRGLGLIEVLDLAGMIDQEKCSKQLAVTVETNVRYHLNQKITDLFIAENVSKITDRIKNRLDL